MTKFYIYNIHRCIFSKEKFCTWTQISLKFFFFLVCSGLIVGLVPNRGQAITRTNNDPGSRRHLASLDGKTQWVKFEWAIKTKSQVDG